MSSQTQPEAIRDPKSPVLYMVVWLLLVVGLGFFYLIWQRHSVRPLNKESVYDQLVSFGERCEIGKGKWSNGNRFADILNRQHTLRPYPLPYRIDAKDQPKIAPGEYFIARCPISFTELTSDKFGYMFLGRIYGRSAIFLDDILKMELADNEYAEFPLTLEDRSRPRVLTIISIRTDRARPGPATMVPFLMTDEREDYYKMHLINVQGKIEIPVFRLAVAATLMLFFGLVWVLGLYRRDLGWMIIIMGLTALGYYIRFRPDLTIYSFAERKAMSVVNLGLVLSQGFFVMRYVGIHLRRIRLEELFVILILSASIGIVFVDESTYLKYRLYSKPQFILGMFVMAFASVQGYLHLFKAGFSAGRRFRVHVVLVAAVLASLAYGMQSVLLDRLPVQPRTYTDFLLILIFAVLLALDLAYYQRAYIKEQTMRIKDRALSSLTSMIAHDLRAPLYMLRNLIAASEGVSETQQIQIASQFKPALERTVENLEDMLADLSTTEPNIRIDMEPVSLNATLCACCSSLRMVGEHPIHRMKIDLQHEVFLLGNALKLQRVFINLINNAFEAADGDPDVWIRSESTKKGGSPLVKITIGNRGVLIPDDAKLEIFEPFYTQGKQNGTGIGLAVVSSIVKAHNGKIWFESREGLGTEFHLQIPASNLPETLPSPQISLVHDPFQTPVFEGFGDVTIVDDNQYYLSAWQNSLTGVSVDLFCNPEDFLTALDSVQDRPPRLVILDYTFRGYSVSGAELAKRLRASVPGVFLVLCSNADVPADDRLLFDAMIEKRPLTSEELKAVLI